MSFLNLLNPSAGEVGTCANATVRPVYDVTETDGSFVLTVELPGVAKEGLEITDEDGRLHINAKRASTLPAGPTVLHRETNDAPYELVLTHDNTVDASKIEAELRDGVLRVKIGKAESAKPRRIAVS
jgi:HSP20 family molecular chaperone IbpA